MFCDKPIFSFELTQVGVAKACLVAGDAAFDFEVANNADPINEMLQGLVSIFTVPAHLWDEETVARFTWLSETGAYNWCVRLTSPTDCSVVITEAVDFFGEGEEVPCMEFECNYMLFVLGIIQGLDLFIKHIGLLNYQQNWRSEEFPITHFLFLKKRLIEAELWEPLPTAKTSNLSEETKILLA